MKALGMSQTDLARASGLSAESVRPIMKGIPGNYRGTTLSKISKALRWSADSIERLLAGLDPIDTVESIAIDRPRRVIEVRWPDDTVSSARVDDEQQLTELYQRMMPTQAEALEAAIDVEFASEETAVHVSASGVDLDELRELDPEAYEQVMTLARFALDRAKQPGRQQRLPGLPHREGF